MKLFKINYRINPLAEVSREVKKALELDPKCRPLVLAYYFEDTVELNERKWDEKELDDTIEAFIKYDLKVLSVALADAVKLSQSKGESLSKLVKDQIEDFKASLDKKLMRGLDELKGDGGVNKAAAKNLTAALKKVAADVSDRTFSDSAAEFVKFANKFVGKSLEGPLDNAVSAKGVKDYSALLSAFGKAGKAPEQAVQGIIAAVKQIKNKKDLEAQILNTVVALKGQIKSFEGYIEKFRDFEKAADAMKAELEDKKFSGAKLKDLAGDLVDFAAAADKEAMEVRTACMNARRSLKQAMTELKLK